MQLICPTNFPLLIKRYSRLYILVSISFPTHPDGLDALVSLYISGIFSYTKDFDERGVIYHLGKKVGGHQWINPASVSWSGVRVSRSSDGGGNPENILEYYDPKRSCTDSWWCVDLGEKYTLFPTHYTLRQKRIDGNFLKAWEFQGSLDLEEWVVISKHVSCTWTKQPISYTRKGNLLCRTQTWPIQGKLKAFRYFRIFRTGETHAQTCRMFLPGLELYGVLFKVEPDVD